MNRLLQLLPAVRDRARFEYKVGLWQFNRRFRREVTVTTKQGLFTLLTDVDDHISMSLFIAGEHELALVTSIMQFLQGRGQCLTGETATVLDVGANNGVISIGMLHAGHFGKAIAIEPDPKNFGCLIRNVSLNGLDDRVLPFNQAASDRTGLLEFELSDTNRGDHRVRMNHEGATGMELWDESARRVVSVEAERIDDIVGSAPDAFKKHVGLAWVDVQGHEGYVFRGASDLFAQPIPVVAEIWPYGIQRAGMSRRDFCRICEGMWPAYWVPRRSGFVKYPIETLSLFFDELGSDGHFENVIFDRDGS